MELYYRIVDESSEKTPMMLLHGLFGSSSNWQSISRGFNTDRWVITPDLRNHGRSFHSDSHSYEDMASDVLSLMDSLYLDEIDLVGHSMGGKTAMWLALNYPDRVRRLVVADIAPVKYDYRFGPVYDALLSLDLVNLKSRQDADSQLSKTIAEKAVRSYLLQNLQRVEGLWQWRINLQALKETRLFVSDFPQTDKKFPKPVLLLRGEQSDYVLPEYLEQTKKLFPKLETETIADAGHWIYAEQPQVFVEQVRGFLA